MPRYKYKANDPDGNPASGSIAADGKASAVSELQQQGYTDIQIDASSSSERELPPDQADDLLLAVSDAHATHAPLASTLRSASMETEQRPLRNALNQLADSLERGASLREAVDDLGATLPSQTAGLLLASAETGSITYVLPQLTEQRKAVRQAWYEIALAIGYPGVILYVSLLLLALFGAFIVAPFAKMYEEFELALPTMTQMLVWFHGVGTWSLMGVLAFVAIGAVFSPFLFSPTRRRRLLAWLPVVGPMVHWMAVVEMVKMLAVMIESGVPLPEAIQYVGKSVDDHDIQIACRQMRASIEQGTPLSQAMQATRRLPPTLIPMVQWGERSRSIPEALRSYADSLEHQAQIRGRLLRVVAPMAIMIFIGWTLGAAITALFLPLLSLIQGLA